MRGRHAVALFLVPWMGGLLAGADAGPEGATGGHHRSQGATAEFVLQGIHGASFHAESADEAKIPILIQLVRPDPAAAGRMSVSLKMRQAGGDGDWEEHSRWADAEDGHENALSTRVLRGEPVPWRAEVFAALGCHEVLLSYAVGDASSGEGQSAPSRFCVVEPRRPAPAEHLPGPPAIVSPRGGSHFCSTGSVGVRVAGVSAALAQFPDVAACILMNSVFIMGASGADADIATEVPASEGTHVLTLRMTNVSGGGAERQECKGGGLLLEHFVIFTLSHDLQCAEHASQAHSAAELHARRVALLRQQRLFLSVLSSFPPPPDLTCSLPRGHVCSISGLCYKAFRDDPPQSRGYTPDSQDSFELASVASAVLRARQRGRDALVVELGAGFGRWSLEAISFGRRIDVRVRAIAVEAEPLHIAFLHEAFGRAGVDVSEHKIVHAAIGAWDGLGMFDQRGGEEVNFGQALVAGTEGTQSVEVVSLTSLLAGEGHVDLIHSDCQGQEAAVLEHAAKMGTLDRVSAVHVATHSDDNEAKVAKLLSREGWHHIFSMPSLLQQRFLATSFPGGDGFQIWVNPKFVNIEEEYAISQGPESHEGFNNVWPPIPHL